MSPALVYLMVRSVIGRITRMARRLREPRYAFGFLVGAAWTIFWLSRVFVFGGGDGDGDVNVQFGVPPEFFEQMAMPVAHAIQLGVALALAVGLTIWWLVPLGGAGLELSEAELHLLLPAPVSRRRLIQYAVLRSQPGVMFGAAVVTFFTGGFWPPLHGLVRFLGLWLFFTVWDLHSKGRGLWLARLRELPPMAAWRRRLGLVALLFAFWMVLGGALVGFAAELVAALPESMGDDPGPVLQELAERHVGSAWNGAIGWLLTPLVWLVRPYFLELLDLRTLATLAAWIPLVLALVAHNEWVVRSQTRFEEAELDSARRRSRKTDPGARFWKLSERRRSWRPFDLAATGNPELGVAWKNLMLVHRMPVRRLIFGLLAAVGLLTVLTLLPMSPAWMTGALEMGGGLLLVAPPFFTGRSLRNDLRTDLLLLETIRSWPLAGWRLFLAEIAAPVWLTLLQMATGAALVLALDLGGATWGGGLANSGLPEAMGVPAVAAAPLIIVGWLPLGIAVALLTTSLENLAALTFPSWVHLGLDKKQAAAKFGQNLLVFFVLSLALLAGLAPGLLAVGAVLLAQWAVWGMSFSGWELPLLGAVAALPTFVVAGGLIRLGGSVWDRLDPSHELLEGRT